MNMQQLVEDAARQVITTTAGLAISKVVTAASPASEFDGVVATISLVGSKGGTLIVYCHTPTAMALATGMLGADMDLDEGTVRDAVGELVNQIAGTIKRLVGADGAEITLTVPVVLSGAPLSHHVKSTAEPVSVELEVGGELCFVCLWPTA